MHPEKFLRIGPAITLQVSVRKKGNHYGSLACERNACELLKYVKSYMLVKVGIVYP